MITTSARLLNSIKSYLVTELELLISLTRCGRQLEAAQEISHRKVKSQTVTFETEKALSR